MCDCYILDGHEPVPEPDWLIWAAWFETANRRVKAEQIGPYWISTIFLGLDHNWARFNNPDAPPILFETMVFWKTSGDKHIETQERCSTWVEAEAQHEEVAARFRQMATN